MARVTHKEPVRFAILAADTVVFTFHDGELFVRLIRVNKPDFFLEAKGLPGGLLDPKENAEEAARRHVEKKAGIDTQNLYVEQLYTFSCVDRDPRGRVVAVAYLALVPWGKLSPLEQKDTHDAWWCAVEKVQKLAYDHNEIASLALKRLCSRVAYTTVLSKLMPNEFTLTELENAYKKILGTECDKRNFRKKILKLKIVAPTMSKRTGGRFRPARLYHFVADDVKEVKIF